MISTRGRYALRMMLDLAENQKDGYVALKWISPEKSSGELQRGRDTSGDGGQPRSCCLS